MFFTGLKTCSKTLSCCKMILSRRCKYSGFLSCNTCNTIDNDHLWFQQLAMDIQFLLRWWCLVYLDPWLFLVLGYYNKFISHRQWRCNVENFSVSDVKKVVHTRTNGFQLLGILIHVVLNFLAYASLQWH